MTESPDAQVDEVLYLLVCSAILAFWGVALPVAGIIDDKPTRPLEWLMFAGMCAPLVVILPLWIIKKRKSK